MGFKIISIDGNIGSGKSTLLKTLKQLYNKNTNIIFLCEPVEQWNEIKDKNGTSMLQKFYIDQSKYSFAFQMMAYISRLSILREAIRNNSHIDNLIIITERSLYTDKYVFAKMLHDQDMIEDVTYQIYMKWFNEFANDYPIDSIIYIMTNPIICYERIQKRSRIGEDCIPLSYLQDCNNYHEEFITNLNNDKVILDGNINILEQPNIINEWTQKISNHIGI